MTFYNSWIIIIFLHSNIYAGRYWSDGTNTFANNPMLYHIIGGLRDGAKKYTTPFFKCIRLTTIKLYELNKNFSFQDSPNLSVKSVLFMIKMEKATSPITITLHADVYNRCRANADILAALEAHTNVSLASAQ